MSASIVVLVDQEGDGHPALVQNWLDEPLTCIDPAFAGVGTNLSYIHDQAGQNYVIYDDVRLSPQAVWMRKSPGRAIEQVPLDEIAAPYRQYAADGVLRHAQALYEYFDDAMWLNPPVRNWAEDKPLQLKLAAQAGLAVPQTLQTNNPAQAEHFVADQISRYGACVIKDVARKFPLTPEGQQLAYWTRRLEEVDAVDFSELALGPKILQQFIPGMDVRITAAGNNLFAVLIHGRIPPEFAAICDWRLAGMNITDNLRLEPYYGLTETQTNACLRLTRRFGPYWGALDFRLDPAGKLWFLEFNPNGAWEFVERLTQLPISRAMAGVLTTAANRLTA